MAQGRTEYAWIGPFIGALIRPSADGWRQVRVGFFGYANLLSCSMIGCGVRSGYYMKRAVV